ncbi:calphotin isoform X2 [Pimephales promelas]|uniref:calphotin isoform X2 n=1 Tax=Pimephales promelas TaxID=90988 RepID=UPI001955E7FB|nr:calphotin isoform X2 [Pimephales promelas]
MPSKRKKNKRRMRRVQAQRRALEEQYASSGKGTSGVCAVSAPVPARVPVAKTLESPISVPIPLAVIAPVVPAEVPPAELVVFEVPVTDAVKDEVVKAAEDLGQSLVEPPAEEPAVIEEDESITIPVSEAISSIDEPVSIPAETEIQFEESTPVATETHVLAQLVETVDTEREVEDELPAKDPVVEVPVPAKDPVVEVPVPAKDPVVEVPVPAKDPVVEVPVPEETVTTAETVAAVETVTETVLTEVEPVADITVEVDGHVAGVMGETAIEAEAITVETEPVEVRRLTEVTEDVHVEPEPEEFSVEAAVPTEALVEPEPEQQQHTVPLEEPTPSVESTSDSIAEEFVVNETVIAVATTFAEEQIPETTTDAPEVPSETLAEMIPAPAPEPLPLPVPLAKEIKQSQGEFMAQVETETIKDLAVTGSLTVDAINGCLGATEVAIEG